MKTEIFAKAVPFTWETTTLGEVVKRNGGRIQTGPFGSQLHASDYVSVGIPTVMPVNIGDNRIIEDGIFRITEADAKRLSRHRVKQGDIIYSRRGDVERRALVRIEQEGWLCGTGCIMVRVGHGDVDATYASYYLGHPSVRAWIVNHAIGATMPNLNTSIMEAIPFIVPPLKEQQAIACILGALDDKIEVNRRMNGTLEAMARAIFQDWFVDFGPVRAKAAGQAPAGLDAAVAALFPARLVAVAGRVVPEGWEIGTIGDLAEVVGGSTPSTRDDSFWANGVHRWATPKDLSALSVPVLLKTERSVTDAGLAKISSGLLPVGTVLLSSRAPIGYLAVAEIPVAINQGFIAMKPREGVSNLFLLLWCSSAHDEILSRANGSTFLEISKTNFRPISLVNPSQPVMTAFDRQVQGLYRRIVINEQESSKLAALRDALLPKLIAGAVRVADAERVVARCL
jgi:type I restriction enzyme S subunit